MRMVSVATGEVLLEVLQVKRPYLVMVNHKMFLDLLKQIPDL